MAGPDRGPRRLRPPQLHRLALRLRRPRPLQARQQLHRQVPLLRRVRHPAQQRQRLYRRMSVRGPIISMEEPDILKTALIGAVTTVTATRCRGTSISGIRPMDTSPARTMKSSSVPVPHREIITTV